jgi:hypothetical protein
MRPKTKTKKPAGSVIALTCLPSFATLAWLRLGRPVGTAACGGLAGPLAIPLKPPVSLDPQIVDLGLAHSLQKYVPAGPQTGIDNARQPPGPKNVVAQLVEEA